MISSEIEGFLARERRLDWEIAGLKRQLAELKAPPTLQIIRHDDHSPHPFVVQMIFEWQGYAHRTMVSGEVFDSEYEYREFCLRQGVEAVVRGHAEAMLPVLVTTDQSYDEYYHSVRS